MDVCVRWRFRWWVYIGAEQRRSAPVSGRSWSGKETAPGLGTNHLPGSAPLTFPSWPLCGLTSSPGGRWSLWCILASVMDIPSSWDHSHPPTPGGVCAATLTLPFYPFSFRKRAGEPTRLVVDGVFKRAQCSLLVGAPSRATVMCRLMIASPLRPRTCRA
jgi:hypothetical protein